MSAKSNKIGVVQLTILTMVNMMGSGIIMLPTKLAEIGTISIVSWLVTAVGSTALAYAFAQCGMFSRKSGGMGGYAEYSFGKAGNFMANYTYGVSLVIANTAIGTFFSGFSTASAFAQADSNPKNAHNVIEIETPIASKVGTLCGFHEFTYNEPSNHFQPMIEIPTTGIITPQMVNELMLPVILAPPKLRIVASQRVKIVHNAIESGERVAPRNSEP